MSCAVLLESVIVTISGDQHELPMLDDDDDDGWLY
jgi:hypothetical protein